MTSTSAVLDPFSIALGLLYPEAGPLGQYRHDPVAFVHDLIEWPAGEGPTAYQDEVLAELPVRKRVAVRGPHGLGKTAMASWVVLWFALTRDGEDWKLPTTAGAWRQLTKFLWPEVHKWARALRWDRIGRSPFADGRELQVMALKLRTGEAFAVASDNPSLIEGAHARHLLYLFDEAKVIPADTFDAAEGAFSGAGEGSADEAYALATSTPGEPAGRFYDIHRHKAGLEDWWTRHVTLDEVIAAGRVTREWSIQRGRQWGSEEVAARMAELLEQRQADPEHRTDWSPVLVKASAALANRVLGEFASSDEDGVIPLAWVEAANDRWRAWVEGGKAGDFSAVGVDVARGGGDKTVLALRFGRAVDELRRFASSNDTMETAGQVRGVLHGYRLVATRRAVVDVIGIGSGVVDRLRELREPVVGFNAGTRTDRLDRAGELGFVDKRSAAWWMMRELLDPANGEGVALPPDDLLTGDLTAPHWRVVSGGKIRVESKDDIRKRLGRSTDSGDAVIQSFWDEDDGAADVSDYDHRAALAGRR